jgi:hypothetical protein
MYYSINVARKRKGHVPPKHIFRTAEDSVQFLQDAKDICRALRTVYPAKDFEITLTRESIVGQEMDWETENGQN